MPGRRRSPSRSTIDRGVVLQRLGRGEYPMLEKRAISLSELEKQAAFELPTRDMMALINVIIFDVIDGGVLNNLNIEVKNNNVAVQICAAVNALSAVPAIDVAC